MKQINIRVTALEKKITELEKLKERCNSIDNHLNPVGGSGTIVDELHQIDEAHAGLIQDFEELLGNTIRFFRNVSQSMVEADRQIADELNE